MGLESINSTAPIEESSDKFVYWGIMSVALGVFISVSLPSIFHIFIFFPGIILFYRQFKTKTLNLPRSSYFLIALFFWAYVVNIINFDELSNPLRSFGKAKYWFFAVISIPLLKRAFEHYINAKRIRALINTFLFSIILAAIYGILKERVFYETVVERVGGFTGVMRYGYGMSLVLTMLLGCILNRKKLEIFFNFKFLYLAFILGATGFLLSKTRGAMIGLIFSIPFIFYWYKKKWGYSLAIICGSFLSIALFLVLSGGSTSFRLFEKLGSSSTLKRISQYHTAINTTIDNPWFGVGVNNFSSLCADLKHSYGIHYKKYCKLYPELNCSFHKEKNLKAYCGHAHNILLESTANMGIVGGVLLILWGSFWLFELAAMKTTFSLLLIPLVINFFIQGQFENIFNANNSFMIYLLYSLSFIKVVNLQGEEI